MFLYRSTMARFHDEHAMLSAVWHGMGYDCPIKLAQGVVRRVCRNITRVVRVPDEESTDFCKAVAYIRQHYQQSSAVNFALTDTPKEDSLHANGNGQRVDETKRGFPGLGVAFLDPQIRNDEGVAGLRWLRDKV
ncbi:hypothetical protein VTI74DRAFT_10965 [Chaetomium olivicolor]